MKKDFIGYVMGYICTTDVDSHGDRFPPEFIDNFKKQIDQNPMLRIMKLQHNVKDSSGEMVEYRVDTKGKWKGLWAKVGVYKNRKDVWEMIEKGELTGFSIGGRLGKFDSSFSKKNKILIKITPQYWQEIKEIIDKEEIKNVVYLKKALDEPVIFSLIITVGLPIVIDKIYNYWKTKREKDQSIKININIQNNNYNFINSSPDEIKNILDHYRKSKQK